MLLGNTLYSAAKMPSATEHEWFVLGHATAISVHAKSLFDSRKVLNDLITCDFIFGCMDSVDGRNLLSRLTNFYLIPYFDLGVRLIADGKGSVKTVVGSEFIRLKTTRLQNMHES